MKPCRALHAASAFLLLALPLAGCGNPLEGGSGPSGSYIRVESIDPKVVEANIAGNLNGVTTVRMRNESAPNTEDNPYTDALEHTNSYVTMSDYRVDFAGTNMSVSIPSIHGGGSVGIPPDEAAEMDVLVVDTATLEYIRSYYPAVGNGENLTLRAKITIWGEDAFQVNVQTVAQVTVVITNVAEEPVEPVTP